jgi:5'-phosphate synthase pdxT subunit
LKTGILALQGSFQEHLESLKLIERDFILIRTVDDLEEVGSIILPGGESTSMIKIQENNDLFNHFNIKILTGISTLGTCAELILLA